MEQENENGFGYHIDVATITFSSGKRDFLW